MRLRRLAELGVSSATYKAIFTIPPEDRPKRLKALYEVIRERVQTGIAERLSDYNTYAAIDYSYELPAAQLYVPIIQHVLSKRLDAESTKRMLEAYGVNPFSVLTEVDRGGKKAYALNPPLFFDVFIPIVKAYTTIRAAKLFADRRRDPLLPYVPMRRRLEDRIRAEVVQELVKMLATWWGYETTLREAIGQAAKYGTAIVFPREEWYVEKKINGETGKTEAVRQGLRYMIPHPTRVFWDQRHPLSTLNTDSGTEWVGCWEVYRWGDILSNRLFWNRGSIVSSRNWFESVAARNYFAEVYQCAIRPPVNTIAPLTREESVLLYSPTTTRDASIILTTLYMKLVPAEYGIGNYRHPVWHRFIIAGDDTVLWAEPCGYTPAWFVGYDYDPHANLQGSIALETLPFQDQIANLLSNIILVCKQNLLQIIYYDRNAVSENAIKQLEQSGDRKYRSLNFLSFDGAVLPRMGTDITKAFQVVELPKQSVAELVRTMGSVLNIMERVLQISAAELGSAAHHYQSAEEIRTLSMYSNTRLQYIGAHIDAGVEAWKRQLYEALMEHLEPGEIVAEISNYGEDAEALIEEIGFKVLERGSRRWIVRTNKQALQMATFAEAKSEIDQQRNNQLATAMFQVVQVVASKPEIFQAVGTEPVIRIIEEAARLAGAPQNFRLLNEAEGNPETVRELVLRTVTEGMQLLSQQIGESVVAPIAQRMQQHEEAIGQMAQAIGALHQAVQQQKQMDTETAIKVQKALADIQIKAMKAQAEAELMRERTQAQIRQMQEKHRAEMALKLAKTSAELAKREAAMALAESAQQSQPAQGPEPELSPTSAEEEQE
jgi:hypothetical protein